MSLSDVAAAILLKKQQFSDPGKAKEAIKATFRSDFPYWNFSDWDVQISLTASTKIFRMYNKKNSSVSIKQLIVDLPALLK